MRITPLIALLTLAACAPGAGPAPDVAVSTEYAEAYCKAKGGVLERIGKAQTLRCIITYADAGKACTDGSQCLGKRCTGDFEDKPAATPATGTCVATNNPFGCQTIIQAGKAATLCVD